MPINLPNGNDVEEIVLPNGANASEVYGPNGKLVWEGTAIPDSGVSRLTFDNSDTDSGTALDAWGSNDGTINGATTGATGANQTYTTNEAYSFDGTDDNVDLGDVAKSVENSALSVSAWVKTTDGAGGLVTKVESGANLLGYWMGLGLYGGTPSGSIEIGVRGGNGNRNQIYTNATYNDGGWHHVVGTISNGGDSAADFDIYVDGVAVSTTVDEDQGATDWSRSGPLLVADEQVTDNHLNGDVDDVRLYSKALSGTEASNLYNTGSI